MAFTHHSRQTHSALVFDDKHQKAVENIVRVRLLRNALSLMRESIARFGREHADADSIEKAMRTHFDAAVRIIRDPLGLTEENSPCKPLNPELESATQTNALYAVGESESSDDPEYGGSSAPPAAVSFADGEPGALAGGNAGDLAAGYQSWREEHFTSAVEP